MSHPQDFDDEWSVAYQWAAMYRAQGLQVVPAGEPRSGPNWKRPILDWAEFQNTLTPDVIFTRWYGAEGQHRTRNNMGLIMGLASGGVFCVDLDQQKDAGLARQWWADLLAENAHGQEILTPAQRTGGGGRHILFRAPTGWSPPTFKTPVGIDIRGQGGFMMSAPSRHESGKDYAWEPGREIWTVPPAEAPEWLVEAVERLREEHGHAPGSSARQRTDSADKYGVDGIHIVEIDEREETMFRAVWGALCDLRRQYPPEDAAPFPPDEVAARDAAWGRYVDKVGTRLTDPARTKEELLEAEGRGLSEFLRKWRGGMRKWNGKLRDAAQEPRPERDAPADPEPEPAAEAKDGEPEPPGGPFQASRFEGDPPARVWVIPDWIIEGAVNSMYGDGGLGKTLLAQQLACAVALGARWLGLQAKRGSVLAVLCEDSEGELHRRHNDIKAACGYAVGNPFADVWLWPRVGDDNVLARWNRDDAPVAGPFMARLVLEVERINPSLLILDTLADFYAGNEISRPQVNYFVKTVLGGLIKRQAARGHVLTILLLGHPSVAGKASGSGYSGSTAWNNAVRSRMYLTRPEDGAGDERILTRGKANYARSGDETAIRLFYDDGVLHACDDVEDSDSVLFACKEEIGTLVDRAWRSARPYSGQKTHSRFIYSALPRDLQKAGFTGPIVRQALREMIIDDGVVTLSNSNGKRGYRTSRSGE